MTDAIVLGVRAIIVLAIYMGAMILIGWIAKRRTRGQSTVDYFLGGKVTGALVLFFTMQATQLSGNSFFGFTGIAYRSGLIWVVSICMISLIVVAQMSYVPRLYVLSKLNNYITPADYYADRYQSIELRLLVTGITIIAMLPYLIIQAQAAGHAFAGLTSGQIPYWAGVLFVCGVMLIYILIGGWRGVVWTDAVQGVILCSALIIVTLIVVGSAGGISSIVNDLRTTNPVLIQAPGTLQHLSRSWLSLLVISSIGFAMYPQAIQRVYAAKDESALKTSLSLMILVPWMIGGCTLLLGLAAAVSHPGLAGVESDRVFSLLLNDLIENHYWLVIFVLCGVLAAIMSTASSVILTLASMFTRDVHQAILRREISDDSGTTAGRIFMVLLIVAVAFLSLRPSATLWRLTEIKVELLAQLFPALILGLYWPRMSKWPAILGMAAGTLFVAVYALLGIERFWWFQSGVYALTLNLSISVVSAVILGPSSKHQLDVTERFFTPFRDRVVTTT
jgi:SSS family solute:Na+ symporter